jgi:hypothetical protein
MSRFVRRYLDPASQLSEILFGLIMVLTVTLTAGLSVTEGKAGVRQLLIAVIGCNLAWGIIDAVTQASGSSSDVRRGPLIGFKYKDIDLTTYWLGPARAKESLFLP